MSEIYKKLSEERKELQSKGLVPEWMSTAGYQLFKEKYEYDTKGQSFKGQAARIAETAAKHTPNPEYWAPKFFNLIWKGWLSCSTPVLANMGTDRGLPVSCSGQYIGDSIHEFYSNLLETAVLTKNGFGTSGYLGDIRPRGTKISVGGKASGVVPVFKTYVQAMRDVAQGTARRGAWAGYLPLDHGDFDELCDYLKEHPDDLNLGWNVSDSFIAAMNAGDQDSIRRYQKALKTKMLTGKGYFFFPDKVNRKVPIPYKDKNLEVKSSNLCCEISLFQDEEHTYTCVLSSLNLTYYDDWKDTDAIFTATVFLDCVASEFIEKAKDIPALEKAVRFTRKGRALGLGVCGFHTYLQKKSLAFESLEAMFFNNNFFKEMSFKTLEASKWMAENWGEPEWTTGYGLRNTHRMAIAPTMSTALIMGGCSQGIEPIIGNAFIQSSAGGESERINPVFLDLMKERGKYSKKAIREIAENYGSVQNLDWLSEHEKLVFRTAFEINQEVIIRLAAQRQRHLDQAQSLNLFFSAEESEEYISHIHRLAFENEYIHSLYYVRTQVGIAGASDKEGCVACQ